MKCNICGEDFELSSGERGFFLNKNLELPKKCSNCRKSFKRNFKKEIEGIIIRNKDFLSDRDILDFVFKLFKSDADRQAFFIQFKKPKEMYFGGSTIFYVNDDGSEDELYFFEYLDVIFYDIYDKIHIKK